MTFLDLHDRCVLPQTWPVCGLGLGPLLFGHVRVLLSIQCVPPSTWTKLAEAVLICSSEPVAVASMLVESRRGARNRKIDRWTRRCRARYDLVTEREKFAAYFHFWTEPPEALPNKDRCSPEPTAMPFLQHVRSILLAHLNYDPLTIDRCEYAQAIMDYYGYMEAEGMVRILRHSRDERAELVSITTRAVN